MGSIEERFGGMMCLSSVCVYGAWYDMNDHGACCSGIRKKEEIGNRRRREVGEAVKNKRRKKNGKKRWY